MINLIKGDLLSVDEGVIAHGCNIYGAMGAGVALAIRNKWPECYLKYKDECDESALALGDIVWYEANSDLFVANCITQLTTGRDGKRYVSYDAIEDSLNHVFKTAQKLQVEVALPWIGCGLGGGNKKVIEQIINEVSEKWEVPANIYEL